MWAGARDVRDPRGANRSKIDPCTNAQELPKLATIRLPSTMPRALRRQIRDANPQRRANCSTDGRPLYWHRPHGVPS